LDTIPKDTESPAREWGTHKCSNCGYGNESRKWVSDYSDLQKLYPNLQELYPWMPLIPTRKEVKIITCRRYPQAVEKKPTDWCGEWRDTEDV
jgi:hypothetical protein